MVSRSVLVAEPNARTGFLQFALTERHKEQRTLEFGLPDCEWSQSYFADVQNALDAAGISCTIENAGEERPVRRFLRAELRGRRSQILQRAADLLPRIAAAMGHPENQTYRVSLLGGEAPEHRHEVDARLEQLADGGRFKKKVADFIRSLPS